jgi:hypothetical protein
MTKTYSNKSNAIRGFKTLHPELAAGKDNAEIAATYLQVVNVPVDANSVSAKDAVSIGEEPASLKQAWAIVIPEGVRVVKRHILKGVQFRRRSLQPEGITSMVHEMFDEYQAEAEDAGKELTRKQMIARAVRDGVAYYTARTQYQKWFRG